MENLAKDKRFAHIAKDPKFRRLPKSERKIKIDKRFQSMFKDKNFSVKYTVDKRGRPVNQTSTENLRKYYELSSENSSSDEEYEIQQNNSKQKQFSDKKKNSKQNKLSNNKGSDVIESNNKSDKGLSSDDDPNFSSNGELLKLKPSVSNGSDNESCAESSGEDTSNKNQLNQKNPKDPKIDDKVRKKLRDLSVDYARGEGVLLSDSSSEEESSEYEEEDVDEFEHNWGELDKETETTNEISSRLAVCNMDWDRIRAVDLMVLFNSFLPSGGYIHKLTIYPSEFGLQRIKEEEMKGPIELVESRGNDDKNNDHEEEDSEYHREKLRQYQLNRLKYYYAVIEFDSANTANKVYTECDGLEYESSATKLDLRFIPDDMTFDQEPKEVCNNLPDLSKYEPRLFTTSALQQVKVNLTWDETDPDRLEFSEKINSGKLNEFNRDDLQAYLASGTSDEEAEDHVKTVIERDLKENDDNPIEKYKSLLKSIENAEEEKKKKDVELEFTWGIGHEEKAEKLVKERMKKNEKLTPFQEYLEKRKEKKIAKRKVHKQSEQDNCESSFEDEDSIPSDVDMNDPFFADELKSTKRKPKKRKKQNQDSSNVSEQEEEKQMKEELELLLFDKNEDNKKHFNMKKIEDAESMSKSKKKRLNKKNKDKKEEKSDQFTVDVNDPRFSALFTSHHYNIDPTDPHYRKTKGTEALISEKLSRRKCSHEKDTDAIEVDERNVSSKINSDLVALVKSVKRKAKNLSA